jgi:rubrerythrin
MPKTAEDILKTAILLELRGKAFYTTSARESKSDAVRKIFSMMAEEEDGHIAFLSRQFAEYEKSGKFARNMIQAHADDTETITILSEKVKKEISAASFEAAAISAAIDFEVDRTNERAFSKRLSYQAAVELPIKSHYVNYPGNPLDLRMSF